MKYPDICVLRHGETEWNVAGRHQGRLDSPLTALGRAQAVDQGDILRRVLGDLSQFDIFSSPQGRARLSAKLAMGDLNEFVREDLRLREVHFGAWEGLTLDEIERKWPELAEEGNVFSWHFYSPGGESFEELSDRASAFLNDLTGPSIIFTHGITSRVLRGIYLGLDMDGMCDLEGGQGCVYRLSNGIQIRHVT